MQESIRNEYKIYIDNYVNELKISARKELLQIILCSNMQEKHIIEKGNGTQIRFNNNDDLLEKIYLFIKNKIENDNVLA